MSKVQWVTAGDALRISSLDHFGSVIEKGNDVHSSLLISCRDVQSAMIQCNAFSVHWCSVQCTLPLKGERVLLHLCAASPNDSPFRERQRNLLLSELSCLVWVSYVKSEPGRKSVNATKRRRGCGIETQSASSQKFHRRKSSTKRTGRPWRDPLWRSQAAGRLCKRSKATRSLSPFRRLSLTPYRPGKVQSSPRRVHCLFDMEAIA